MKQPEFVVVWACFFSYHDLNFRISLSFSCSRNIMTWWQKCFRSILRLDITWIAGILHSRDFITHVLVFHILIGPPFCTKCFECCIYYYSEHGPRGVFKRGLIGWILWQFVKGCCITCYKCFLWQCQLFLCSGNTKAWTHWTRTITGPIYLCPDIFKRQSKFMSWSLMMVSNLVACCLGYFYRYIQGPPCQAASQWHRVHCKLNLFFLITTCVFLIDRLKLSA